MGSSKGAAHRRLSVDTSSSSGPLHRNRSWGLLQELRRLEQSPGVYHGAMFLLAIDFHAQLLSDIFATGLRFNLGFLMSRYLWGDFLVMLGIIFFIAVPLALASNLLTSSIRNPSQAIPVHALLVIGQIAVPHCVLLWLNPNPIIAGIASATSTCLALKTHSFFVRVTLESARTQEAPDKKRQGAVPTAIPTPARTPLLTPNTPDPRHQKTSPEEAEGEEGEEEEPMLPPVPSLTLSPSTVKRRGILKAQGLSEKDDAPYKTPSHSTTGSVRSINFSGTLAPVTTTSSSLHFLRFLFVPELVYNKAAMRSSSGRFETERERNTKGARGVRIWEIVNNWAQGMICLMWIAVVACQRIVPMLLRTESLLSIHSLGICVPANLCWFLAFYCVFKANFSILAELTQYPIRRYYQDWWNATTVEEFWRRWNVPVHDFAVHHVFHPCIYNLRMSPGAAGAVVFVLSALLHEITFAVAFRCPNCYFITLGMLLQVPIIHFSRQLEGTRRGNILVWINFVLGITLMAQLYFQQWHKCCSSTDRVFKAFYRALD